MNNPPSEFSYQILGRHMREARKNCKLTQAQIAEILSVSTHYYNSLERGKENISFPRFTQFVVITKAMPNDLLSGCQEGIPAPYKVLPTWGKSRQAMESLLDKSSEEAIRTYLDVCTALSVHVR